MSETFYVTDIKDEKCIEWEIPRFFETSGDVVKHKIRIQLHRKDCSIYVYPCGPYRMVPEYVMVYLHLLLLDSNVTVNFFLHAEGCENAIYSEADDGIGEHGPFRIWVWNFDSRKLRNVLNDDVLRGRVIISSNEKESKSPSKTAAASQTSLLCNTVHFCRDFQDLLLTGSNSDVTIEVQGRLFKVHKLILGGCSLVFAAMFDHDVNKKNKAIHKVDDCDPDIFQVFLKCLYSGKIENIPPDSLMGLYMVSDKYCVSDLKKKCSEVMARELSEDTLFDILAVADMYNDAQLKESAETFLVRNSKTLKSKTWKKLQSKNPSFVDKILSEVSGELGISY